MSDREWKIRELLRNHRVQLHYKASQVEPGQLRRNVYAVFVDGIQVTEPKLRLEARKDCEDLLVAAIVKLFEGA